MLMFVCWNIKLTFKRSLGLGWLLRKLFVLKLYILSSPNVIKQQITKFVCSMFCSSGTAVETSDHLWGFSKYIKVFYFERSRNIGFLMTWTIFKMVSQFCRISLWLIISFWFMEVQLLQSYTLCTVITCCNSSSSDHLVCMPWKRCYGSLYWGYLVWWT